MSRPSGVSVIRPPVAGTRLTQTRMFIRSAPDPCVLRVEQRRAAGDGNRDGVALAEVLDGPLQPLLRVVRREIRHHEVTTDRRPGPRTRDIRAAALGVDEWLTVG